MRSMEMMTDATLEPAVVCLVWSKDDDGVRDQDQITTGPS